MNPESHTRYVKPEASDSTEQLRHHRFEVVNDGKVVSAAEVNYYSRPIPFYQVTDLYTEVKDQGRGYASAVMDQVENFLIQRGKPGILADASIYNHPKGKSFYASRGWIEIGTEGHRAFNLPKDINPDIFAGYYMRGADVSES